MDDRSDRIHNVPPPPGDPPPVAVLAVDPADHPVAHPVVNALRQAGCRVIESADVYQAVVALARDPTHYAAVALPVDYFNREELRFFPMAKRRWPALKTIALARPAFAYKAAVAELAGADLVCTDAARADDVLALLGAGATQPDESAARGGRTVTRPERPAQEVPAVPQMVVEPQPPRPTTVQRIPAPEPVAPPRAPQEILTEEEIAALMADMDTDDEQPLPKNGTLDE